MKHHAKTQRPARINSSALWFALTQLFTLFGVWATAAGGNLFRFFALGSITGGMLLALLANFQAGLLAMIVFEPFRGFLRRAQYLFVPYSSSEPIHLVTPAVTFVALLIVLQRQKLEILRATPLAGAVSLLAAIYFIQIFNPLQGGIFIGLTGALFYLVPVAWFYFGQAADARFVPRALRLVVILGLVASLHGLYQMIFGYPEFEQYWIDNTDLYSSIAVYNVKRALATFNSAEEWGRYVQIGCVIAFGLGITKTEGGGKRFFWIISGLALVLALALTGQRSAIFGLFLSFAVLFLTGAASLRAAFGRLCLLGAPLVLILAFSAYSAMDDAPDLDDGESVNTMLTHTTKGTVKPTGEGSLYARLTTWTRIITEDLPANPLGNGLGAEGIAASRETNDTDDPTDNHFFSVALAAGALLASFILNNFFGTTFTIYSVAPLGWLVIGWLSASYSGSREITDEEDLRRLARQ
jgi:hypothetical protein